MSQRISALAPYAAWLSGQVKGAGKTISDLRPAPRLGQAGQSFHKLKILSLPTHPALRGELLAGRFSWGGTSIDTGENHPWEMALPSMRFAGWLHCFGWLETLLGGSNAEAATRGQALIDSWGATYGGYNHFAYAPDLLAERVFNWAVNSPALFIGEDSAALTDRRAMMLSQLAWLRRLHARTTPGLPRLISAAAQALGGALIQDGGPELLALGLDRLDQELALQILADGGHVDRSPASVARAYRVLLSLDTALDGRGLQGSNALSRAIDRIGPMLATLQHRDGGLACFGGAGEGHPKRLAALMRAAPGTPKPFGFAPHYGLQRVEQSETLALMDTGATPPAPFDREAHLAPLALEISIAEGRMITACGWSPQQPAHWRRSVRSAAAHSGLILNDGSPGALLEDGWKTALMGQRIARDVSDVSATRKEQDSGIWIEASHNGYRDIYGLAHRRRLYMSADGEDIRGEDSLYLPLGVPPMRRDEIPFDIRFHFHPDTRVSLAQNRASALIVVGGQVGWRFLTDGGEIKLEPSVYLGRGHAPERAQQIIISGRAYGDGDGEARTNRVRWTLRRLRNRTGSDG